MRIWAEKWRVIKEMAPRDKTAKLFLRTAVTSHTSGQSYKASMSVNYNTRVVLLVITTLD